MIDVNWDDNAKAAVREFAGYIGQSNMCERYLEAFETKKTVADAVEWAKGKWIPSNCDAIAYNPESGKLHYYKYSEGINDKWFHCCFREEFEAYVKEQEGEKWTHTYSEYGVRKDCVLVCDKSDINGQVLVLNRYGEYVLTGTAELKPIKPTISKAEAWDLCQDYEGSQGMVKYMLDLHDNYEII